ncbi:putative bifunctional diguanylate cyclase/phosphodiesterase [Marinobacterium rhizophilum]|uniref:EAL domain-containing protein n=1 Tax=Marinobacterium rhizophilum TaxID=420402 RepID=A0ABY5HI47_9GAMM|nr:EAL domain-containing protein [Marinobacterium rhizophilum]UTW12042.1 EAL domain-containing protein [Marinobacterium rhizophilum]
MVASNPILSSANVASAAESEPPAARDHLSSTECLHILVVDDNRMQRMLAREALRASLHDVSETSSGEGALAWLADNRCDAVLLDACMPGLDGFETCRHIRELPQLLGLPVVIATGLEDEGSIERAFACGATDYVIKPVNWQLLRRRLPPMVETGRAEHARMDGGQATKVLLDESPDALLTLDAEGCIRDCRGAPLLPENVGRELKVGRCLFDILPGDVMADALDAWREVSLHGGRQSFFLSEHDANEPYVIEVRMLQGENGQYLCVMRDCTSHYLAEKQILALACFDAVTGLANATKVHEILANRVAQDKATDRCTGVIRCVIENYGTLSRRLGLEGMRALSVQVAHRLQNVLEAESEYDILAGRLSDSEFVLLVSGPGELQTLQQLALQVYKALVAGYSVDESYFVLQFRMGLATSAQVAKNADMLLNAAAQACNDRSAGADIDIGCYSDQVHQNVMQRHEMERVLRRDIADNKLELHYQPKYTLDSLVLVGMEALARWQPAEFGPVSPGQFIPLAQECGLLEPLTDRVVERALDQAQTWQEQGMETVPISINLPGCYLNRPGVVDTLIASINKRGLSLGWVELEVTENLIIASNSQAAENLAAFKQQGLRIAIDDFGTGYSSLSYLQDLPVQVLKIDMSFIRRVHTDEASAAIARAIINVGHELGLEIVAEGVEHEQQLECLRAMHCDVVQGYYTGRPVPPEQFEPLFSLRSS